MINNQFILVHGMDEFVVKITVNPNRKHVWSAKNRDQANKWVQFWEGRANTSVVTMTDYMSAA